MDIYIDVLIIVNTYITWLLLSLTSALTHTCSKGRFRAAASFIGGISALIMLIPSSDKLIAFTVLFLKFLSCILIVITAFWKLSPRKYTLLALAFIGVNMLMSAALELLQRIVKVRAVSLKSGFIYLDISPINLIISTAVIYFVICKASKLFSRSLGTLNSYRVNFRIGRKAFSLDGVADTGNTARDLFSGLPVIICTGIDIEVNDFVRAVPYKTIAGDGILYAVNPGKITVTDEQGAETEVVALVAGLPGAKEQRAIFNPKILT